MSQLRSRLANAGLLTTMLAAAALVTAPVACLYDDEVAEDDWSVEMSSVDAGPDAGPDAHDAWHDAQDASHDAQDASHDANGDAAPTDATPEPDAPDVPNTLPVLVAIGDSVTSGHHGGGSNMVCDDPGYGYPARVWANLQSNDGENWYLDGQYVNVAHSGFGTAQVIGGGTNACGASYSSPLDRAVALLQEHADSVVPNKVVMSVGVNNTNWVDLLAGFGEIHFRGLEPGMTAADCESYMLNGYDNNPVQFDGWTGPAVSYMDGDAGIFQGVLSILNALVAADPDVEIYIVNYYNMANTGYAGTSGPFLQSVCDTPAGNRVSALNGWIADAVSTSNASGNVAIVGTGFLNGANAKLQQLAMALGIPYTVGWPHPNTAGHQQIGDQIEAP